MPWEKTSETGARWIRPTLPEFCGPYELALLVDDYRSSPRPGHLRAAISTAGLTKLLSLAYSASLQAEEGAFTKCCLYVPPADSDHVPYLNFTNPHALNGIQILRKLAPASSFPHGAIAIREISNDLEAFGFVPSVRTSLLGRLGQPRTYYEDPIGLLIRVLGPGHVRAGGFELRGGRVFQILPTHLGQAEGKPLRGLTHSHVYKGYEATEDSPSTSTQAEYGAVKNVWHRILESARSRGHGGAFVCIPPEAAANVDIKYPSTGIHLVNCVREFLEASEPFAGPYRDRTRHESQAWLDAAQKLETTAARLADISTVDGAVVLLHGSELVGFGGVLRTTPGSCPSVPVLGKSERPAPTLDQELQLLGTRHRSALQFCRENIGTIAFVISQDGDLRLFVSSTKGVIVYEPLSWIEV